MRRRVNQLEGLEIGQRRIAPVEIGEFIAGQAALDRLEPRGEVGVLAARIMLQAVGVAEKDRRHRAEAGVVVFSGVGPLGPGSITGNRRRRTVWAEVRASNCPGIGAIDIDIRRNDDIFWTHLLR